MPIGEVHQTILVRFIPDGLTLTVTNIKPIMPDDGADWSCNVDFVQGSVGDYNTVSSNPTQSLFFVLNFGTFH